MWPISTLPWLAVTTSQISSATLADRLIRSGTVHIYMYVRTFSMFVSTRHERCTCSKISASKVVFTSYLVYWLRLIII